MRALAALLLASCVTTAPRPPETMTRSDEMDSYFALGRALLGGQRGVEMAMGLGRVVNRSASQIEVAPADARFSSITILLDGTRAHQVWLAGPGVPSLKQLEARFGEGTRGTKTHPQAPLSIGFRALLGEADERTLGVVAHVPNELQPQAEWRVSDLVLFTEARIR